METAEADSVGAAVRSTFTNAWHSVRASASRFRKLRGVDLVFGIFGRTFGRNISQFSAGIAYFALLSLFPLLILAISIASTFLDPDYVSEQLTVFLDRYVPVSGGFIEKNIDNVLNLRGPVGVVSFVMLVLSGSALFASLSRVANGVLGIQGRRPFYTEKVIHLAMMAVTGALVLASILTTVLLQVVTSVRPDSLGGLESWRGGAVQTATYLVAFTFTVLTFLLVYRLLPNATVQWRRVLAGSIVAALLFELSKLIFIYYMRNLSNPELIYGSLGSAVALLLWCYISAHIFVIGAAVIAELGDESTKSNGPENVPAT